ncbi:restriction endonuclease subunit S [Streptomyces sp. NPDC094048]|uniref:restriction endonuclease subunit S n=1 Tax=Streptomyces sp. NPDC094048 TaxID=3155207 RepID=UPI00331BC4F0
MADEERVARRKLSDLADVTGGVALGREVPASESVELPYLRVANVQDGYIDTEDVKTVRVLKSEVERFRLRRGDVLLTEGGDFDKLGRGAVWDGRIDPCLYQNHIFRVRCNPSHLVPEYLSLFMASPEGRSYFLRIAKQTTNLATINSSQLKAMPVPWPPIAEQRRIVEAIDSVSRSIECIQESITKTRVVRREVARVLMGGIEWTEKSIGELATVGSGGTPSRKREDFWNSGVVPWVRTSEINFSEISETAERITPSAVSETGLRIFPAGTVLVAMYGEGVTRGRSAILTTEATVNQAAAAIVCDKNRLEFRYLYYWLESSYQKIRKIGQGSNQTNLNASLVSSIRLPVPSLDEQRRVASQLGAFDARLAADASELNKLSQLKSALVGDLLSGPA